MDEQQIEDKLDKFEKMLMKMDTNIQVLVRSKNSNKQDLLKEELNLRGRMDVNEVKRFFKLTRQGSLDVMRKLGTFVGYTFLKGNKNHQPSIITYTESDVVKFQFKKIKELCSQKLEVTIHDIYTQLSIDVNLAKIIAKEFVETNKEHIFDGIKIKKSENQLSS